MDQGVGEFCDSNGSNAVHDRTGRRVLSGLEVGVDHVVERMQLLRRRGRHSTSRLFSFDVSVEEVADQRHHFVGLVLQGEMAGVYEVKLDVG